MLSCCCCFRLIFFFGFCAPVHRHWEEVQAKIAKDLAEETAKEREMIERWQQRRESSEKNKLGFAEAETKRVQNKNIKRKEQLVEFETKTQAKITEAKQQQEHRRNDEAEGEGKSGEGEDMVRKVQANIDKWTAKLDSIRTKAEETLKQSLIDLNIAIEEHETNELKQMELSEKNEKIEFQQWQQDRRDYDTKGEGLLKGLRYACCDTTNGEQCADMLPNETFDLIVDKGKKKVVVFETLLSFVHV